MNALFKDSKGNIWIGTVDKGLLKYSFTDNSIVHYVYDENDETSLSSNTVHNIYQDFEDNIWIATDNGLSIYNDQSNLFERFTYSASNPYSLSSNYIMSFFEDLNGLMWIGTNNGLNRWNSSMTTFRQYSEREHPAIDRPNITSFAQANKDSIYFSAYNGRIYQYLVNSDQVIELELNKFFKNLRVMTLFYDDNSLWVGTRSSGLYRVDLNTQLITSFIHDEMDEKTISANSITDIIKDSNGVIWVSTFYQGLNRLNLDGSFTRYINDKDSPTQGPSNNSILHLLEGEAGIIWIATYGGGLSRFDTNNKKFHHIFNDKANPNSISSDFAWFLFCLLYTSPSPQDS